jgi:shikimate dehydrogenase
MGAALTRPLGGMTLLTGIFGDPVEHSLSPAMHNAAYAALRMERAYVPFHVVPAQLGRAVRAIPALGLLGVNLTVPHKERATRLVDQLSLEAGILGAVNCVVNRSGHLYGDNTDARGLEKDLRELETDLRRRLAIIIGAGGAGAAAVLACLRLGADRIVIANRTRGRALSLSRRMARRLKTADFGAKRPIEVYGLDALCDGQLLSAAAVVINATPMGLTFGDFVPLKYEATPPDCLFYDMVYGAKTTAFLKPARGRGRRTADGAGMLVNQGELAFDLFNKVAPPKNVMRRALMDQLGRRE